MAFRSYFSRVLGIPRSYQGKPFFRFAFAGHVPSRAFPSKPEASLLWYRNMRSAESPHASPFQPHRAPWTRQIRALSWFANSAWSERKFADASYFPQWRQRKINVYRWDCALLQNKTRERSTPHEGPEKAGHGGWRSLSLRKQALLPLVALLLSRL